jgi:hypothetical protein
MGNNCYNCIHSELSSDGKYPYTLQCKKRFVSIFGDPNKCTNFEPIYNNKNKFLNKL